MTYRGDEPSRRSSHPALGEAPTRVRASPARLPALLVILALAGVAGAGLLGRAGSPPPTLSPGPPLAAMSSIRPTTAPTPAPTITPSPLPSITPPPRRDPPLALVDPAYFWLVVLQDGGGRLERSHLSGDAELQATIVVRPEWQPGRVRIRLFGQRADGRTVRLADVPLPAVPSRALELPVELASDTVALRGKRPAAGLWDLRITLEEGARGLQVVAEVTPSPRVTR